MTPIVVEMQQLSNIENVDSKQDISCLDWRIYKGRRKLCVNFKTDEDKLDNAVYGHRNTLYLNDAVDLKLAEYQTL